MNDPEGIDLLDRLDHANRQKDISDFVASVPRHHLSARDTEMLLNELQSHDSSSKASSENGDVDNAEVESKYLSRQNPEFQALTLLSRFFNVFQKSIIYSFLTPERASLYQRGWRNRATIDE